MTAGGQEQPPAVGKTGETWYLGAHIGKGTSRDPRHTIRIGFVRDEEGNRVIIGFIGLHQRNRQS